MRRKKWKKKKRNGGRMEDEARIRGNGARRRPWLQQREVHKSCRSIPSGEANQGTRPLLHVRSVARCRSDLRETALPTCLRGPAPYNGR
jgi:hypothetical protein